ncbi:hypothetical protein M2651_00885 [Clostridium sp. SYSU_GA19001]|uniref:hypothetical protein n=1 Tax=Clostridium caldaquaticum TaxID=2940653 RepID=UPI0020777146|nr:hypothetical protein [Clostridium caldaquaticum]MCM8709574.1 hypothetical protein [Clostridium caldaquaticum]
MRKVNLAKKTLVTLLTTVIALSIFTGCKNNSTAETEPNTYASSSNNSQQNSNSSSNDSAKENNNSKPESSDTVSGASQKGDNARGKLNTESLKETIASLVQDKTITETQGNKILEAFSSTTQKSTEKKGRFNPLSQLVSDGVITQEQADKVMEKIIPDSPPSKKPATEKNEQPTT